MLRRASFGKTIFIGSTCVGSKLSSVCAYVSPIFPIRVLLKEYTYHQHPSIFPISCANDRTYVPPLTVQVIESLGYSKWVMCISWIVHIRGARVTVSPWSVLSIAFFPRILIAEYVGGICSMVHRKCFCKIDAIYSFVRVFLYHSYFSWEM